MKLLAIDTSTARQSVALMEGDRVIGTIERDAKGSHAKWLIPTIHEVLNSHGMALDHLEGLAVSIGPGSFTGLRVGLATMLGFRSVSGLPLAAVPTLEAMAWGYSNRSHPLCPLLSGRTGEVYWGVYRWEAEGIRPLCPDRVGPVEEVWKTVAEPMIFFGEGWDAYRERLQEGLAALMLDNTPEVPGPAAVNVGRAGFCYLQQGKVAPSRVSPHYVQRSEAEVVWDQRAAIRGTKSQRRVISREPYEKRNG